MTTNYTWELYQEGTFLTSGPFSLTASGTTSDSMILSINGLYGNVMVDIKNGTTPSAVQIASLTVFCENHPKVTINQATGQSDPAYSSPILFTANFESPVSGFTASDVTINGMAGTPGISVTGSGTIFTIAVTGMVKGETVTATIPANAALSSGGYGSGYGNQASTSTDNKITYMGPPIISVTGSCDKFGNSVFTITNTGGDMQSNYTWEIYQEGTFLTSEPFSLTGSGANGSMILSINGLYGNVMVDVKNGTTPSAVQIASAIAFCENHPKVTINQATGQNDPTNSSPILFTANFESPVSGFTASDVTISGMAGTPGITVTGSGTIFTIAVTGMANGETVIATIPANVALSSGGYGSGYGNQASTSTDNHVTYDLNGPTVTINQAAGQSDPTKNSPINFDVVFSKAVTGFTNTDVKISGMAATPGITVTDSGDHMHFTVAVTGMASSETVTATIPSYAALDSGGHGNFASTSTDNSVKYDTTAPTVTINQAAGQSDPTKNSPINFDVVFSEAVTSFANTDVKISGMAATPGITVTDGGDHMHFTVAVTGMANGETITATIPANTAQDLAGNLSTASTSTDNSVIYDTIAPTVTINQAAGQSDPTNNSPIDFDVVFSEAVTGFVSTDVQISGMAATPSITVTDSGDHMHFTVAVTGMANGDTATATIPANAAQDLAGNLSTSSTSTDNSVTYDSIAPTVTINQAAGQLDPTNSSPINFDVAFSKAVTGFVNTDVQISGMTAAPAITVTDSGDHMHFTVVVAGMVDGETVTAAIPANAAQDAAGNPSAASISTDKSVTYDVSDPTVTINQASGQSDPTNNSPIYFAVAFNEAVAGFTNTDVQVSGMAAAPGITVTDSGDHMHFTVAITGMANGETVSATIPANVAQDMAGNLSVASTSTDNSIAYDTTAPMVTSSIRSSVNPSSASSVDFTVTFSESVTGVDTSDFTLTTTGVSIVTVGGVSGSGNVYTVAVNTGTGSGTIRLDVVNATISDLAGNSLSGLPYTSGEILYDQQVRHLCGCAL